jgi:hypothetical protein
MRGTENPHNMLQHVTVHPKENTLHSVTYNTVYCPFFFAGNAINRITYLDLLEFWLMSQLWEKKQDIVSEHDGVLPHTHSDMEI